MIGSPSRHFWILYNDSVSTTVKERQAKGVVVSVIVTVIVETDGLLLCWREMGATWQVQALPGESRSEVGQLGRDVTLTPNRLLSAQKTLRQLFIKKRSGVSATMAESRRCHPSNAGTSSIQTTISSPFYTPNELIDFKR
jgi:hypothetical protein